MIALTKNIAAFYFFFNTLLYSLPWFVADNVYLYFADFFDIIIFEKLIDFLLQGRGMRSVVERTGKKFNIKSKVSFYQSCKLKTFLSKFKFEFPESLQM